MRLLLSIYALVLTALPLTSEGSQLPPHCAPLIDEVVANFFPDTSRDQIEIAPLTGGNSNTSLKVTAPSGTYALRIKGDANTELSLKRELYAMTEAARIGIAPVVRFVSKDLKAMLMDYVDANTVMLMEAKEPANCAKIADTIRKAHSIARNPYVDETLNDPAMSVYHELINTPWIAAQLNEAKDLMWDYTRQLEAYESPKVNIHGELNSRNIFLTPNGALFIDWEYAGWEDPFFDLSYLAIRLAYTPEEERVLLENYLQHPAVQNEIDRYYLTKKIHLAQLCIYFHGFSLIFNPERKVLSQTIGQHDWLYYMKTFSDQEDDEEGLAQFYFDMAEFCLKMAKMGGSRPLWLSSNIAS